MTKRNSRITAGIALASAAALALVGCASGDSGSGSGSSSSSESADPKSEPINLAVFNGWDEGIAASELWKAILEEEGYTVNLEYADVAAVYLGISEGSYDLVLDTWLPITHEQYIKDYGDNMVDLGYWNDEAKLTIAVNEDAPIDSLDELAANADLFNNEIVGIEAGSGLVTITQDEVVPGYGLESMNLITSSTPAMLAALSKASTDGDNIAVTLWRPHWAYSAFPIKDLKDPKGLLGDAEKIHSYASTTFSDDYPEVAEWIKGFKMPSDTLYSLEDAMFNGTDTDEYGPIVADWISENQDWVDSLTP